MVIQFFRILVAFIGVVMGFLAIMGFLLVFAVGIRYIYERGIK